MIDFTHLKYVKTKIEVVCYLIWRDATKRFNMNATVEEIDPDLYII